MQVQIQVNAQLTWRLAQVQSGGFIAICDPLGLTLEGDSPEQLQDVIAESLHELLTTLLHEGRLSQFLHEKGWRMDGQIPDTASPVRFNVPFNLLGGANGGANPERTLH